MAKELKKDVLDAMFQLQGALAKQKSYQTARGKALDEWLLKNHEATAVSVFMRDHPKLYEVDPAAEVKSAYAELKRVLERYDMPQDLFEPPKAVG